MVFLAVVLITAYSHWLTESLASDAKPQGGDDLQKKVQNPVGSLISVPLKLTADFGAPNGSAYIFNVNPVGPVTVGEWNLINRALSGLNTERVGRFKFKEENMQSLITALLVRTQVRCKP